MTNQKKSKDFNKEEYGVETRIIYEERFFVKGSKKFNYCTHWVDPITGEDLEVTPHTKLIYNRIRDEWSSYNKVGYRYFESYQSIANYLGISRSMVKDKAIPLLKRMGLVEVVQVGYNKFNMIVYGVNSVKGKLVNYNLKKEDFKKVKKEDVESKTPLEWIIKDTNSKEIEEMEARIALLKGDIFSKHLPKAGKVGFKMKTKEEG